MTQLCLLLTPPRLDRTDALRAAKRQGDAAIAAGAAKASVIDPTFIENACAHILAYLGQHGVSSGEILSDSCKLAGIKSTSDKHFGPVIRRLLGRDAIEYVGPCKRTKGHGSRGGSLYRLKGHAT